MFEMNLMTIDFVADLILQSRHDILRRDRTERFAGLAGFEFKDHPQFIDAAGQFSRSIQLAGFAFGPFLFQILQLTQGRRRYLMRFAARQKIVSSITATHFHNVRLGSEPGDIVSQNDFSRGHEKMCVFSGRERRIIESAESVSIDSGIFCVAGIRSTIGVQYQAPHLSSRTPHAFGGTSRVYDDGASYLVQKRRSFRQAAEKVRLAACAPQKVATWYVEFYVRSCPASSGRHR